MKIPHTYRGWFTLLYPCILHGNWYASHVIDTALVREAALAAMAEPDDSKKIEAACFVLDSPNRVVWPI